MRPLILVFTASILLLTASAVSSAPTCEYKNGDAAACVARGAMPAGWALSPQQTLDRRALEPPEPGPAALFGVACFIGGLFTLVLLMPKFDGWDKQEDDDE